MTVLVTGAAGQLGYEFSQLLGQGGVGLGRSELDLADFASIRRVLHEYSPSIVINSAAYTAVDKAELESETCLRINSGAVKVLADATREMGIPLVQISSDYVFCDNPKLRRPRTEEDPVFPKGRYAESKAAGEVAARRNPQHFIIRTCGLYGAGGPNSAGNFVKTMLRIGPTREFINVVDDQFCTPTWIGEFANAVLFLANTQEFGTYHITNQGETNWFNMTKEIFRIAKIDCEVRPISSADYGAPAPRPCYSVLNTNKYHSLDGPQLSQWDTALGHFLSQYSA